jgi:hypothetical protein
LRKSLTIQHWLLASDRTRGNARSNFAIFAECWKLTHGFTAKPTPDLSEKAGLPCVTQKETPPKRRAPEATLKLCYTAWKATLIFQ